MPGAVPEDGEVRRSKAGTVVPAGQAGVEPLGACLQAEGATAVAGVIPEHRPSGDEAKDFALI